MISNCSAPPKRVSTVSAILFFLFLQSAAGMAESETPGNTKGLEKGEKIHITAEKLISSTNNNNAEFIGHVRVTQGETRIDADRLQIFFNTESDSKDASPEQSLDKLVASGNVRIKFDNRVAVAQKAVYITKNRIFTLTGPGATITSGDNTISGETITFYRDDGRFTVHGGNNGRVEAVILPNDSGLE